MTLPKKYRARVLLELTKSPSEKSGKEAYVIPAEEESLDIIKLSIDNYKFQRPFTLSGQYTSGRIIDLFSPEEFNETLIDADYDISDLQLSVTDKDDLQENGYFASRETPAPAEKKAGKKR